MVLSGRSFAILLNICGQVLQNVAALLMNHGQQHRAAITSEDHESSALSRKHPAWWLGVVLLVVGALAVFASYGAAEQSLLSSLISVQFVSNVVFGRLLFGRAVTEQVLSGTAVIIVGTTVCILNTPRVEINLSEDDLRQLYFHNAIFQRFFVVAAGLWALVNAVYNCYEKSAQGGNNLLYADLLLPCCYVAQVAIPSSLSIIAAKTLAILMRDFAARKSSLFSPLFMMSLCIWLVGTACWLRRMNGALTRFDGSFIIPLCQINWSFFTIVAGGFFYHEFQEFTGWQLLFFVAGACANFFGAAMLRPQSSVDLSDGTEFELLIA